MGEDNPGMAIYYNLLELLYEHHPIRDRVAGTVESISHITPELLYNCHKIFYHPSNMYLCVAGAVSADEVFRIAEKCIKTEGRQIIENFEPEEPREVAEEYFVQQLDVAKPLFALGFKQDASVAATPKARVATEHLLERMAGHYSKLYTDLVEEKLINPEFSFEHFTGSGYSVIIFSGESSAPAKVAERIKSEVARMRAEGINGEAFLRAKRKNFGQTVMMFNSVEGLSSALCECAIRDEELFDFEEIYSSLNEEDLMAVLDTMKSEYTSLSVIEPKE